MPANATYKGLVCAAKNKRWDAVLSLVKKGGDPNTSFMNTKKQEINLAGAAACDEKWEVVYKMIGLGADPNSRFTNHDGTRETCLAGRAAEYDKWSAVHKLVELGADSNSRFTDSRWFGARFCNGEDKSLVGHAASNNKWKDVFKLLEHGADPTSTVITGGRQTHLFIYVMNVWGYGVYQKKGEKEYVKKIATMLSQSDAVMQTPKIYDQLEKISRNVKPCLEFRDRQDDKKLFNEIKNLVQIKVAQYQQADGLQVPEVEAPQGDVVVVAAEKREVKHRDKPKIRTTSTKLLMSEEGLTNAVAKGSWRTVLEYVNKGGDPNHEVKIYEAGKITLAGAAGVLGVWGTVFELIKRGADPSLSFTTKSGAKMTLAALAAKKGDLGIIERLVKAGVNISSDEFDVKHKSCTLKTSVAGILFKKGYWDSVSKLIEWGASPADKMVGNDGGQSCVFIEAVRAMSTEHRYYNSPMKCAMEFLEQRLDAVCKIPGVWNEFAKKKEINSSANRYLFGEETSLVGYAANAEKWDTVASLVVQGGVNTYPQLISLYETKIAPDDFKLELNRFFTRNFFKVYGVCKSADSIGESLILLTDKDAKKLKEAGDEIVVKGEQSFKLRPVLPSELWEHVCLFLQLEDFDKEKYAQGGHQAPQIVELQDVPDDMRAGGMVQDVPDEM